MILNVIDEKIMIMSSAKIDIHASSPSLIFKLVTLNPFPSEEDFWDYLF